MYKHDVTLFGTRLLVLLALMLGLSQAAQAAAIVNLQGEATDVKYADDALVRLSLLGFTDEEQGKAVTQAFGAYLSSHDPAALEQLLKTQETKGYLFTKAATGYSVKYAWRDADDANRMVLVVTPGLKTRNPYLWKTPNTDMASFTVVAIHRDGDQFSMKTSLDGGVTLDANGQLQLQDYATASTFATLEDNTPYYLKQST